MTKNCKCVDRDRQHNNVYVIKSIGLSIMFAPTCNNSAWDVQGGPKIVSHYKIIDKSYYIVLKPASEIRFFRQLKVSNEYYNIITWY